MNNLFERHSLVASLKKIMQKIFSLKNSNNRKVLTLMGIQLSIPNFVHIDKKLSDFMELNYQFLFNSFQDKQIKRLLTENEKYPECVFNKLNKIKKSPQYLWVDENHNYLNILLGFDQIKHSNDFDIDNAYICWEIRPTIGHISILNYAMNLNKDVVFIGDSFLRSIDTFANKDASKKYKKGISFTIDDLTMYFDATRMSRLEQMLNDKTFVLTEEQKNRARKCIDKIVSTHLTKYNHQPIFEPQIGRKGVQKVLVVDQSYGDMSILKGWGNDNTFKEMLEAAIKENPDADIVVKTHPDTMTGNNGGYYTGLKQHKNIYPMTEPINPISLIKYVDKVYVCTTQFGFEALMCNKEVHVFGMPFYAGWGLTHDRQFCERRTNKRTLEELFYIAYIVYSHYVNPEKKCRCEIEDAIDYLLELRKEYFNFNVKEN